MSKVVLITGASSGFGALAARRLADAGHTVYAAMRATRTRNAPKVGEVRAYADEHSVALRAVELDVQSQDSADAAVAAVLGEAGRIDVVVHNAGHMAFGPAEAFTPEQYAALYDVNVLGTQRAGRAHLRATDIWPVDVNGDGRVLTQVEVAASLQAHASSSSLSEPSSLIGARRSFRGRAPAATTASSAETPSSSRSATNRPSAASSTNGPTKPATDRTSFRRGSRRSRPLGSGLDCTSMRLRLR